MGSGGRTTFYINGRLQGFVPRQVMADVLRLGNHPAGAEGAADGAAGVLADVRLYGSALDASAVRELFVSASLRGAWGGLGPYEAGVWGSEGETAPAKAVLDDAPPQSRTASPPLAACSGGAAPSGGPRRKRQAPVMESSDDDSDSDAGGVRAGADTASSSGSSTDNTVLTAAEPPIVTRQVTPPGRAPANVAPHAPQRPYSLSSQLGDTAESPIVLD